MIRGYLLPDGDSALNAWGDTLCAGFAPGMLVDTATFIDRVIIDILSTPVVPYPGGILAVRLRHPRARLCRQSAQGTGCLNGPLQVIIGGQIQITERSVGKVPQAGGLMPTSHAARPMNQSSLTPSICVSICWRVPSCWAPS